MWRKSPTRGAGHSEYWRILRNSGAPALTLLMGLLGVAPASHGAAAGYSTFYIPGDEVNLRLGGYLPAPCLFLGDGINGKI